MSFLNIPEELRLLPQWVVWDANKVPHDAKTGNLASVNDRNSWSSFDIAVQNSTNYSGIGFVFSDTDDYSFIDLDDTKGDQVALNRQIEIYREFDSWSEISPSGKGLHIIVRGSVPAGRRRSFIEVYSSGRYATFTGNVYNNNPIRECQEQLTRLWQQMGDGPVAHTMYHDQQEKYNDEEIIRQASNADNGQKFILLQSGVWQGIYPSQSEADFAFIDIVAFYTQNRKQISRLFLASALGQRSKAKRSDYLTWMINKSFDRMLPPIDFDGFRNQLELKLAQSNIPISNTPVAQLVVPAAHNGSYDGSSPSGSTIEIPPGLLGELAQFIYSAAPRPVPEIALAGAIGLMAGIAGRSYNVNGEGLNQYILLIAQSGTGKEAMASGIDRLMASVKILCPTSNRIIGPAEISSGDALIKYINNTSQCFVSILSEFGYRLQNLSDKRNFAQTTLKKMLLDLYHKSGKGRIFYPKIYADKEKNISETSSPSFSILAESTPGTFYECVTEEIIADGFLPRFTLIEYKGIRVALNENSSKVFPVQWLVEKFSAFIAHCETLIHNKNVKDIPLEDDAAKELAIFDKYCDALINQNQREDIRQLYNRAHIKAWKLAGIIAIGVNPFDPSITLEHIEWALKIVRNDINILSTRFEAGEIGTNTLEVKQQQEAIRIMKEYVVKDFDYVKKYTQGKSDHLHQAKVIPVGYLSRRLSGVACFRNDKMGATIAIRRTIQNMIESDKIRELTKKDLNDRFNTTQRSFIISSLDAFGI